VGTGPEPSFRRGEIAEDVPVIMRAMRSVIPGPFPAILVAAPVAALEGELFGNVVKDILV